jgi:transposase
MSRLFYLSDAQWEAIKPHLPPDKGRKPRLDDRRIVSGIIHVLQSGCRWRDAPTEYGYPTTLYNRYNRWSARGIWHRFFRDIVGLRHDERDSIALDSTHIKAHRCAGGGKGGLMRKPSGSAAADAIQRSMLLAMVDAVQ